MERIEPLTKFPIVRTNRVEEAESLISRSLANAKIKRVADRRRFHLRMNGLNFGRTSLVYNRFGTNCKVMAERGDTLAFIIGSTVPSTFDLDGESFIASPHKAVMVTPTGQMQIQRPEGSEILVLRTNYSDILSHVEDLTGSYHRGSLMFDYSIDLTKSSGAMLKRMVNYMVSELQHNDLAKINPGLLRCYDEMLLTALLSLPNNQWEKLNDDHYHHVAPRLVRRAEEYMQAHLDEAITTTDLLRICCCSRSALFATFQKARGYTPKEFLSEQRLQSVRQGLRKAQPEASVASIASECGFTHLGRFANAYRKRFGELPSETLRLNPSLS